MNSTYHIQHMRLSGITVCLGCVYKDHVYQQGETWKDGCTYSCTCHDAATGKYTCTAM